ncbi:tRNA (guanine37-N1)-methyltransferase [Methanocalculus alkaliphilus]|uniref:class I SAM-dependent methyltransferase n=1 Tax=Methanocalculus alkaliphilus TaxID=768730 RepID=UPI00209F702A|nr:methyltransferase [Methanocalculus alkaliphilus]MCP1715814.1 tRNA (guanine37-N1)-methyltransferase [Methanocalculus alkaliphilus]
MIEAWAVRIPKRQGEERRRELIQDGVIAGHLRPEADGDDLLIPVTESPPGTERALFREMQTAPPLPRHEQVGGIAIIQENDPRGAERILAARPSTHTVLHAEGAVEGEFRTKTFSVLAGIPTTRTTYPEYGHRFTIDLSSAYFSSRLATERQRIRSMMNDGEAVCDMFCGVGPFPIILADRAGWILACDKNPGAIHLLIENLTRNRTRNVLPMLGDAARLGDIFGERFDRVLMNLPLIAHQFLQTATVLTRPGGTIHLYALQEREGEYRDLIQSIIPESTINERFLRSYSAGKWHAVYDIRKKKD